MPEYRMTNDYILWARKKFNFLFGHKICVLKDYVADVYISDDGEITFYHGGRIHDRCIEGRLELLVIAEERHVYCAIIERNELERTARVELFNSAVCHANVDQHKLLYAIGEEYIGRDWSISYGYPLSYNVQVDEEDTYCQTWIFFYAYYRAFDPWGESQASFAYEYGSVNRVKEFFSAFEVAGSFEEFQEIMKMHEDFEMNQLTDDLGRM